MAGDVAGMTPFPKVKFPTALFELPRWQNGPHICRAANLPAFETRGELDAFLKKYAPSCKVIDAFQCEVCKMFHARTLAPDPAGGSSGTGRSSNWKTPREWDAFFHAKTPAELLDEK